MSRGAPNSCQLSLKKFNPADIPFSPREKKGPTIVMIGRRGTGKSELIKDILYHHQDLGVGTVISATETLNRFYADMVPKCFIHKEYSPMIIESIIKRQVQVINQYDHEAKTYGRVSFDPRTFLIMDDCLYDDKWAKDKLMRWLFMNGRHAKVMLMITMQYPLGIPPNLRSNVDYVFIMRTPGLGERKRIWENYASIFPTFESFCSVLDKTTENFECMVINNTVNSSNISDCVFWYKAVIRDNIRLGAKEFWELSRQMEDDDNEAQYNSSMAMKRSQGPTINVKKYS
jgi:hypothetical protein